MGDFTAADLPFAAPVTSQGVSWQATWFQITHISATAGSCLIRFGVDLLFLLDVTTIKNRHVILRYGKKRLSAPSRSLFYSVAKAGLNNMLHSDLRHAYARSGSSCRWVTRGIEEAVM